MGRVIRKLSEPDDEVLIGNPGTTDDPAPTESGTWPASSQYDISRYTVQAWSGSAWQTVASRSGNTKHIVRLAFGPVTTDRIRVIPTDDASNEVVLVGNPGTVDDAAPSETSTWASSSQFDTSTYTVQAWSGSAWQTVASVSGNTKHIVRLAFAPVTTDRIRVIPTDDASNGQTPNDNLVSLTEIEVRSPAGAGEIRAQRFDAWGKLEQAAGSVPTYGYTGREPDATGLIHYRARYYHPELGRFVSRDPLGLAAGINPYAYAGGNPVLFNDPDGLMARLAWNAASGYWAENNVGIRLGGAMQAANGVGEFALGGAIGIGAGWTGVGGVVGGGLMVLGADQASAGFQTLVSGRSTPSLVNQGFQAAGASPTQAAWGEAFVNIGASAGASGLVQGGRSFVQAAGVADDVFAANAEVTVYRVFGGDARAQGFSWTTKDPRTVSNFRDAAGLPSGGPSGATNTADFLIKGRANASDVIKSRSALPLDGNKGGLPELIIDPKNVRITDFSVLKP